MENQVMEWKPNFFINLTGMKSSFWFFQYVSAMIPEGVTFEIWNFKVLPKMVIFGYIGHAKFNFIIKI